VGRKGPREHTGPVIKPTVGKAVVAVPGAVRVGEDRRRWPRCRGGLRGQDGRMGHLGNEGRKGKTCRVTFFFCIVPCKGDLPRDLPTAHAGGGGFLMFGLACRGGGRFPMFFLFVYTPLWGERR
jgi:hypothetical protein